jgi:pyruvate dehydrogenase E1 component
VVAASDSVRAWPQLVAGHAGAPFTALGTDGFGRSDTRQALRQFFEVDRFQIVLAALSALQAQGRIDASRCLQAIERYAIGTEQPAPWVT